MWSGLCFERLFCTPTLIWDVSAWPFYHSWLFFLHYLHMYFLQSCVALWSRVVLHLASYFTCWGSPWRNSLGKWGSASCVNISAYKVVINVCSLYVLYFSYCMGATLWGNALFLRCPCTSIHVCIILMFLTVFLEVGASQYYVNWYFLRAIPWACVECAYGLIAEYLN